MKPQFVDSLPSVLWKAVFLVVIGFSLAGCNVYSDSGVWKGAAVIRDSVRGPKNCSIEVDITHNESLLALHHVNTNCEGYATNWRAGTFEVHGDTLWRNGKLVGSAKYTGEVELMLEDPYMDERYPYPARTVRVAWARNGEYLEYTEEAYFAGRTQTLHAWLRRYR